MDGNTQIRFDVVVFFHIRFRFTFLFLDIQCVYRGKYDDIRIEYKRKLLIHCRIFSDPNVYASNTNARLMTVWWLPPRLYRCKCQTVTIESLPMRREARVARVCIASIGLVLCTKYKVSCRSFLSLIFEFRAIDGAGCSSDNDSNEYKFE